MAREWAFVYGPDGRLITGTLTLAGEGHWYMKPDGSMVGPLTPERFGVKQAVKVRLHEPITLKEVPGEDRRTGYWVGNDGAFLLEKDVTFREYPAAERIPDLGEVVVTVGTTTYRGPIRRA